MVEGLYVGGELVHLLVNAIEFGLLLFDLPIQFVGISLQRLGVLLGRGGGAFGGFLQFAFCHGKVFLCLLDALVGSSLTNL